MYAPMSQREDTRAETIVMDMTDESVAPTVGLIMGSKSDWDTMRQVADTLNTLGIRNEPRVISAHRSPNRMFKYAKKAEDRKLSIIIAGAGGAAHLPGMTASKTILPVIGVPVNITPLKGLDALLSIMQMPAEVGVATTKIGPQGAVHAALFAASILALHDSRLYSLLRPYRADLLPEVQGPKNPALRGSEQKVLILAGAESDREFLRHSEDYLARLACPYRTRVVDPALPVDELLPVAREAEDRGTAVFIAGSGNGIELARKLARTTMRPVLAVPIVHDPVECVDTFLEPFLNMPSGVATFAINRPGAINAALFAANILSGGPSETRQRLKQMQVDQRNKVRAMDADLRKQIAK
jgi:5-(carboxyamino)imidazole ribonucleotide mutase